MMTGKPFQMWIRCLKKNTIASKKGQLIPIWRSGKSKIVKQSLVISRGHQNITKAAKKKQKRTAQKEIQEKAKKAGMIWRL